MNIYGGRDPGVRRKLVSNLHQVVGRQVVGLSGLRAKPNVTGMAEEEYFQRGPLTSALLSDIYGNTEDFLSQPKLKTPEYLQAKIKDSSDKFLKSYEDFAETYYKTIANRSNLAKGVNVDVDLERAMGRIDLKLLNAKMQKKMYEHYTNDVLRLPDLIRQGGLPTMQMPSANMYSESFKYLTAFEEASSGRTSHISKIILNKLYFSFNRRKPGLEGFTVGKSNLLSPESVRQTHEQLNGGFFQNLKKGTSIATLDIETTGVFQLSQARSYSVSRQIVGKNGVFGVPQPMESRIFQTPQLDEVRVGRPGGGSRSLSELLSEISDTDSVKVKTPEILDSIADLFDLLNDQDMVIGHNLNFDIQKLVTTAQDIDGFGDHRVRQSLIKFFEKKKGGGFVYDTLDVAREYLNDRVMQGIEQDAIRRGVVLDNLTGQARIDELSLREKKYIEDIFAQETLAKVHLGGSATPFSMENIALNTNLFHLIEQEGQADQLITLLSKGTHIEKTDTVLQGYVLRYIQTGQLDIDRSTTTTGLTEFIRFARRRTSQSSAITPTTNIADVTHLSDEAFDFISRRENLRGLSVEVSNIMPDYESLVARMGLQNELIRGAGFAPEHQGLARNILRVNNQGQVELIYHKVVPEVPGQPAVPDVVKRRGRKGRGTPKGQADIIVTPGRPAVPPVPEQRSMERLIIEGQQAEDIKSTLIDILQRARSSSYTNLSLATGSGVFPPFNPYNLSINDLGDSYQTFSRAAQLASTASMSVQPNLSQKNILQAFGSVYETYGTGLSERDRISLSTVFGRDRDLPFDLGMKDVPDAVAMSVAERFALIGDPFSFIDPNSRVMSTIISDVTSGLGVQLNRGIVRDGFEKADLAFSAQPKQMAELGLGFFQAQDRSSTFRMLTPGESGTSKIITPYEIVQAAFDDVMGKKADTLRRVGFSIFQDGDQSTVNLVWNISEQLGDVEQKAVMKKIFDIMSDADEVAKVMGKSVDELDQTLLTDIQAVKSAIGRPGAALNEPEMLSQALEVAKKRGIVIGNLGPEESERLIRAFGRKGVEFTNDVTIKSMMTSIFRHGGDRSVLVTTPVIDMDAARKAGQIDKVDAANKVVREVIDKNTGQTRIRSKQIDSYNKISSQFFDKNFLRQVTSKVRKSKLGETDAVVAGLYNNYKKNIAIGAAVAGLGAFAYYKTKKNREQKLYEDVIKTQEYETLRDEDPLKDIQGVYNYRPITSDPLATAGVVGSLDRSKIGHTRMGNDRYNHLFNVG